MELTKERAKENLAKLIEKFESELSAGRIKEYNEEATKTAFIQPFLKDVLGLHGIKGRTTNLFIGKAVDEI
jgi:hypothetical protein